MTCKDKSITYLRNFGYSVIRVPKADIQPLQIFIKERGILKPLGELSSILNAEGVAIPSIKQNQAMAAIKGQRSSELSAGVGISILGSIIGAMGGSKLGLDAKFSKSKSITFEFSDVLEDSIEIARLDQFLANADVNPNSRQLAQLLEADEIFVSTSIIKSKKFTIDVKKKNAADASVTVPEIKEIIGGNVSVKAGSDGGNKIEFEGGIPLGFGFQAVQLVYEDGQYRTFNHLNAGQGAVDMPQQGPKYFVSPASFVDVTFN
jgi:hypothetical protein